MLISLGLFSKHQEYYFLYFIHYDFVSFPPPAMASVKETQENELERIYQN